MALGGKGPVDAMAQRRARHLAGVVEAHRVSPRHERHHPGAAGDGLRGARAGADADELAVVLGAELAVRVRADLDVATKVALGSMLSTAHANLSVGPPYDIGLYRPGSMVLEELRVEADSPLLGRLQELWHKHQLAAIAELPTLSRESLG